MPPNIFKKIKKIKKLAAQTLLSVPWAGVLKWKRPQLRATANVL
jgi:hypothetical protein